MCGIFAIASKAAIDPELLWFGTHRVSHRGPDDWGFVSLLPMSSLHREHHAWRALEEGYAAGGYRVGLGSRRLSILDLSEAGHQPMTLADSGLWIVFNGEIYNYRAIRAELSSSHRFSSGTDTEVLLAAYQRWGSGCLARLNGMFSFAIYDSARRRLFMARDRFGEKPLYYLQEGDRFICASELKQFFEYPGFDKEIDRSALVDFFLLSLQDHDERTFFSHVKQLRPAHWIEVDLVTMQLCGPVRYWVPQIAEDGDSSGDADLEDSLMSLLIDSVRLRLRSDVPVGVCLSGGIDSATICSIAAAQDLGSLLNAYTMAFPGQTANEQPLAERIAKHTGVRHRNISMAAADLWDGLRDFAYLQDGPVGGASIFASWQVFHAAHADGTTVLLNGQGCDEFFAGYNKFVFFWWQILFRQLHWWKLSGSFAKYLLGNGFVNWDFASAKRYLPPFLRDRAGGIQDFALPEFRRCATPVNVGHGKSVNLRLWKDLSEFSLPCLLHWEDRNSMSAGTEARLPFLDHRIVEAVLKTSARTKLNAGYTKYMLRKTMDKHVPQEICWRRVKNGFETPAQHWFATDLAPQIEELLSREGSPLSSFFDLKAIQKRFHNSGAACLSEFDWFKLMTTDVWLEQLKRAGPTRQASPVAQCGG